MDWFLYNRDLHHKRVKDNALQKPQKTQKTVNLLTCTKEILHGKLHSLCSERNKYPVYDINAEICRSRHTCSEMIRKKDFAKLTEKYLQWSLVSNTFTGLQPATLLK